MDISSFDTILGGGGFGTITTSKEYPDLVLKTINISKCACAQYEFLLHKRVYDAFSTVSMCDPVPYTTVPNPVTFERGASGCWYVMEKLNPLDKYFIHLSLDDALPRSSKDRVIGRVYDEPVSDTNPARGIFASKEYVEQILSEYNTMNSISDIVFRMGYLFSTMVFGAQIYPVDVEYGLALVQGELTVSLLDFGLALPHSFELDKVDIPPEYQKCAQSQSYHVETVLGMIFTDVYYSPEEEYREDYIDGINIAYNCFLPSLPSKAQSLYKIIIDYIEDF